MAGDPRQGTRCRPWIAALIGVIHGLGFASSLSSFGVAASQRVTALAAFNVGIDIAQTLFVLVVLGVLWMSARVLGARVVWLRTSVALGAALFGIVWTTSRVAQLVA